MRCRDGLAANTMASYRRDLMIWGGWLVEVVAAGCFRPIAQGVQAYLAFEAGRAKAADAARRMASLRKFYLLLQFEQLYFLKFS